MGSPRSASRRSRTGKSVRSTPVTTSLPGPRTAARTSSRSDPETYTHTGGCSALDRGALAAAGCAPGGYYNSSRSALDSLLTSQAELMKRVGTLEKKVDATRE